MTPRLKNLFVKEIQPKFKEQFNLKNLYMVPEIRKIVINMGLGLDGNDSKIIKHYTFMSVDMCILSNSGPPGWTCVGAA